MKRYFGIDFGTTTTAFAVFDPDSDRCDHVGDEHGNPFHSVIVLDRIMDSVAYRGLEAWERRTQFDVEETHVVISSVKQNLSHEGWPTANKFWTPVMVASEVLKNGMSEINNRYPETEGLPIKAVMAVPVDFEYEERRKIEDASKEAGIDVIQFVSEPTAAVIGLDKKPSSLENTLVFDWGGGTLDVSVLKITGSTIKELAKMGKRIGGDSLDELIARYLHYEHKNLYPDVPSFDEISPIWKDRIITESELKKRVLSNELETEVYLHDYCDSSTLEEPIDRKTLVKIIREKIKECIKVVESTITDAGLTVDEIDRVLIVGGSSNIPIIRKTLDNTFGARCVFPDKPDWCIAKGAAKLAANSGSYVLSKSIGIVLSDNSFLPVLISGEPIDHKEKTITLGLVEDAKEARLIIAESFSERHTHGDYKVIDHLMMNIPSMGYYFEPFEVSFKVQKDLALSISTVGKFKNPIVHQKIYPHLKFEYRMA